MNWMIRGSGVLLALSCTGCLVTRAGVKETEQKRAVQDQVITLQRSQADQQARFNEIDNDFRQVNGRLDVLENKINTLARHSLEKSQQETQKGSSVEKKFELYQEELTKLNTQVSALTMELQSVKAAAAAGAYVKGSEKTTAGAKKGLLEQADDQFDSKDWKSAIFSYQKYIDQNPKSKKNARALLRIGLSFQELGLTEEAKPFLESVTSRFPESAEAKTARARLKKR